MPAALIASMLKIALAAQSQNAAYPAQVLSGLNQTLCGKFEHHYVTAAYLFMDLAKKTLTYSAAGHPPLLSWSTASAGVREITENGLFLGKFPWATYTSLELPLSEGDRYLLYTDGIPETLDQTSEFGVQRFRQFLRASETAPQINSPRACLMSCSAGLSRSWRRPGRRHHNVASTCKSEDKLH